MGISRRWQTIVLGAAVHLPLGVALGLAFTATGCNAGGDAEDGASGGSTGAEAGSGTTATATEDGTTGASASVGSSTSQDTEADTEAETGGTDTDDTGPTDIVCSDLDAEALPLAPLPELQGVVGEVRGAGVTLHFEPFDGARDYRVYALPTADAVQDGGELHIENAIYRCAGDRPANDIPYIQNSNIGVDVVLAGDVGGYDRAEAESTLGHVFLVDGPQRLPVYSLGSPESGHDGQCYGGRFRTTRATRFTTDLEQREQWLDQGWRDDGVAFYAPELGDRPVYFGTLDFPEAWVFYASDAEVAARGGGDAEFSVLDDAAADTVPLRRFLIQPCGGIEHDVLSAGESRFQRDYAEGAQPHWTVQWPNLQPDEILVVEALDEGCPFQGHLSGRSLPPTGLAQAFVTIDDVQAAAPYGEVFVNGQHDPASTPQPVARSFVCPQPEASDVMDVFEDFSAPMGFVEVGMEDHGFWDLYLENDDFFASFFVIEPGVWGVESVLGELWVTYADWAADTGGLFRLTSKTNATLAADSFVHATVEVDMFSTGRRYPQLWISSAPAPVQVTMDQGVTLNLQLFNAWPTSLQVQRCDNRLWAVNDQCPIFPTEHEDFSDAPWPAHPFVSDTTGSGLRGRLDLWASTDRAYVFLNGEPYSCVEFDGLLPAGDATVTFGDALYHSGVDEPVIGTPYLDFLREYQLTETRRHVDNFGFSSGQPEPEWNHARLPCATTLE